MDTVDIDAGAIWNTYTKDERCYVEWLYTPSIWPTEFYYPTIKCLVFEYCDRGIHCWKLFGEFLKKSFPNLKCLFLTQNFSMTDCYSDNLIEKTHADDFFQDDWLEYILVNDGQTRYNISNDSCTHQFICEDLSEYPPLSICHLEELGKMLDANIKTDKTNLDFIYLESNKFKQYQKIDKEK